MNVDDRIDRWLDDLESNLAHAARLVARGRAAYDADDALQLAFEALSNRVGDLAKRLSTADSERFADPIWRLAARNRDFVVHHYDRVDLDLLWTTVARDFLQLAQVAAAARR